MTLPASPSHYYVLSVAIELLHSQYKMRLLLNAELVHQEHSYPDCHVFVPLLISHLV
jgi:hypothetical protein